MRTAFAVIGFVVVALVVGTCVACADDEDDEKKAGWGIVGFATVVAGGNTNEDDNRNGDCRNTHAECSDDDQLAVIVCVEPDSCRF